MNNFRLLLTLSLLVLLSKNTLVLAQSGKPSFVLHGEIENLKDSTLVVLMEIDNQTVLAETYTRSGKFVMKGNVKSPTSCYLQTGEEYAVLMVENTKMNYWSPAINMHLESKTSGGREQDLQNKLNDLLRPVEKIITESEKKFEDSLDLSDTRKSELKKNLKDLDARYRDLNINFGKENINSYVGVDIVYRNRQTIGKSSTIPLYQKLSKELKNTTQGRGLEIFLFKALAEVGSPMLDFDARTLDGNAFKLSELKGKFIYLTFGSLGCGPCRMENKLIAENIHRLNNVSFVNFSMDRARKAWETATGYDKITWYNVSDLPGEVDKVKNLYDVQGMPTSFLIDKKGITIKKFIGFDPGFIEVISKLSSNGG